MRVGASVLICTAAISDCERKCGLPVLGVLPLVPGERQLLLAMPTNSAERRW